MLSRVIVLVLLSMTTAAHALEVRGRIVDATGRGLQATVRASGSSVETSPDGTFRLEAEAGSVLQVVVGRDIVLTTAVSREDVGDLVVTSRIAETITVASGTRQRLAETSASVILLSRQDIESAPQHLIDETLRQVPGFTLFRRTSSRTANPTSQGVSLRGVGPSGASRALVLDDGITLNDPFGGWVYWGRVPQLSIEQVEVLRGGGSDLYGSSAVGGVVSMIRRVDEGLTIGADVSSGTDATNQMSMHAALPVTRLQLTFSGEYYATEGYVPVVGSQRGAVDIPADSEHRTADLQLRTVEGNFIPFLRLSYYDESRANGTPLQRNATTITQAATGIDWSRNLLALTARVHAQEQDFEQSFTAVSADRHTENLTRLQNVPTTASAATAQLHLQPAGWLATIAGIDVRRVDATNDEVAITATGRSRTLTAARQDNAAMFVEALATLGSSFFASAGLRYDGWTNEKAVRRTASGSERLADRDDHAWSPRVAATWSVKPRLTLTASAYEAFRAPTLNELYRSFRVGNVLTLANDALTAEELRGYEIGFLTTPSSATSLRLTYFDMRLRDAVSNVTLSSTPSLITRQRQNVGETSSEGVEIDFTYRPPRSMRASFGYLYADSMVESFDANRALEGKRLPQVPRHHVTAQLQWDGARVSSSLQARCSSSQFDDDRNELELSSWCAADLLAGYAIRPALQLFGAVENLSDSEIEASLTPVTTLASPRSARFGIRWRWQRQ